MGKDEVKLITVLESEIKKKLKKYLNNKQLFLNLFKNDEGEKFFNSLKADYVIPNKYIDNEYNIFIKHLNDLGIFLSYW